MYFILMSTLSSLLVSQRYLCALSGVRLSKSEYHLKPVMFKVDGVEMVVCRWVRDAFKNQSVDAIKAVLTAVRGAPHVNVIPGGEHYTSDVSNRAFCECVKEWIVENLWTYRLDIAYTSDGFCVYVSSGDEWYLISRSPILDGLVVVEYWVRPLGKYFTANPVKAYELVVDLADPFGVDKVGRLIKKRLKAVHNPQPQESSDGKAGSGLSDD